MRRKPFPVRGEHTRQRSHRLATEGKFYFCVNSPLAYRHPAQKAAHGDGGTSDFALDCDGTASSMELPLYTGLHPYYNRSMGSFQRKTESRDALCNLRGGAPQQRKPTAKPQLRAYPASQHAPTHPGALITRARQNQVSDHSSVI